MRIFLILVISSLLFSCSNKNNEQSQQALDGKEANVWLNGTVSGAENMNVKLIATLQQGPVTLGETTADKNGTYKLAGAINGLGIYQLQFGDAQGKIVPLPLNINDKLEVSGNLQSIDRLPTFKNTKWASNLTQFFVHFNEFVSKQEPVINDPSMSDEEKVVMLTQLRKPLDNFSKKAIESDPASEANLIFYTTITPAMGYEAWDPTNLDLLKSILNAYQKDHADSPFTASVEKQYNQIAQGYEAYLNYQKNGSAAAPQMGLEKAPEIALPNPTGKIMRLSDLKGKYVLVDFWASWCGPCRRENPNVVKIYDKYHSKGFEIFSVSLDKDGEAWKRAITSDNLKWKYHVSDLKQWESSVIPLYGFDAIPYTVLLDPKGNIIATNLRGAALEQKLSELLK